MRLSSVALGVCLLGSAAFCSANSSFAAPVLQDAPAQAASQTYQIAESVFTIQSGQNAAYYDEAEKTLRAEMQKFMESKPAREEMGDVFGKANNALMSIARNRIDTPDVPAAQRAQAISVYGNMLSNLGDAAGIDEFIKRFENDEDPAVKSVIQTLVGKKRFANLVGNDVVMEGLFLDGTEIDWSAYRGKVVLIDFWATWCGPCVAEIPNVQAMYEKYHAAGFEVVGYSVDQDLDALKKFEEEKKLPWKTMSRTMSMEAKDKTYLNMSAYYGVTGIPTMILVGKDGKALSTSARGPELQRLLKNEFPEVK